MKTRANRSKDDESGFTLTEVMVAAMLVATFFVSIFELNAMSLRYNDASKESLAALQSVQIRAEALRNLAISDLTTTSFVRDTVMPANYLLYKEVLIQLTTILRRRRSKSALWISSIEM